MADQLCYCPTCKFPANYNYLAKYLEGEESTCPMCNNAIDITKISIENQEEVPKILKQQRPQTSNPASQADKQGQSAGQQQGQ